MNQHYRRTFFLLVSVALLSLSVQAAETTSQWINPQVGDWSVPANWSAGVPASPLTALINNGGTAQITADVDGPTPIRIAADGGSGTVELLSGTLRNTWLELGSAGTFRIAGGLADIYGTNGGGNVEQTGGFMTMWEWFVYDRYRISGGLLEIRNRLASFVGSDFEITGNGKVRVAQQFEISSSPNVRQSGGTLISRETEVNQDAVYRAQGGIAEHDSLFARRGGVIEISGGEVHVGRLFLNPPDEFGNAAGRARVLGGTLAFHNSILNGSSPIDFQSGAWTLDVRGGITSLYNAQMPDVSQAILKTSAGTLTILPAGVSATAFADADTQGIVHTAGSPLTIPVDEVVHGMGDIPDRLIVEGQLIARDSSTDSSVDPAINAQNGIRVLAGGAAKLGRGHVTVRDEVSGLFGGDLRANRITVGTPGAPGKFVQTGGVFDDEDNSSDSPELRIGHAVGARGLYEMTGGQLNAEEIWVGWEGEGQFNQSGGSIDLKYSTGSAVIVGPQGSYELSGGELRSYELAVLGRFLQTGGLHFNHWSTGDIDIGEPNAAAVYELRGGTHRIAGRLSLARFDSSQGTYIVAESGHLDAAELFVSGPGAGIFRVEGGSVSVGEFRLGTQDLGSGTLELAVPSARFEISERLTIGARGAVSAVPGSVLQLTGTPVEIRSTDPVALGGLNHITFEFTGGPVRVDPLEVAGADLGAVASGFENNFALAGLTIGASEIGRVQLVNQFDNSPGAEALYVGRLSIGSGSSLDLNGLTLYYRELSQHAQATVILNGGQLVSVPVPELDGLLLALEALGLGLVICRRRNYETSDFPCNCDTMMGHQEREVL
jgi:hypothetical protein